MSIPASLALLHAKDLIQQCLTSQERRLQRGAMFRNIFLTGDENGDPQTYPYTYSFIDNLSSLLYSPVELRLRIEQYGYSNSAERAKFSAASSDLHRRMRRSGVDTEIEDAVTWSLVKGKCLIKLLWSKNGFEPYLVQPETFGVLREDLDCLERQDAFVHCSYFTRERFAQIIATNPNRDDIMRKASRYLDSSKKGDNPAAQNNMRQVILGGINPYQQAGGGTRSRNRGMVDWLGGPAPDLSADVMADLIRVDELYVWDGERDDYTTIQMAADDVMITSKDRHRNLFADMYDPDNPAKYIENSHDDNPLTGRHPFIEICPNRLNGYFWGRSEICNVGLLQKSINNRVNGINALLRIQEDPPRMFAGGGPPNQSAYSKLKKPGGYMVESNPGAKAQSLAPDLPPGLWDSLHELENMYEKMAGLTPTLSGRGEHGVRAAGHSDRLTSNASPRFKDRALIIERQIEELGGLALDMAKAKIPTNLAAWVMPGDKTPEVVPVPGEELEQPPVEGMKRIDFTYHDISDEARVCVDSHSSSPVFIQEARGLLVDLFKLGLSSGENLISHIHPPGGDQMIEDLKKKEIAQMKFAAEHPEIVAEQQEKAASKKKK